MKHRPLTIIFSAAAIVFGVCWFIQAHYAEPSSDDLVLRIAKDAGTLRSRGYHNMKIVEHGFIAWSDSGELIMTGTLPELKAGQEVAIKIEKP